MKWTSGWRSASISVGGTLPAALALPALQLRAQAQEQLIALKH